MNILLNGDQKVVDATTVAQLVIELGLEKRMLAVERNLEVVNTLKEILELLQNITKKCPDLWFGWCKLKNFLQRVNRLLIELLREKFTGPVQAIGYAMPVVRCWSRLGIFTVLHVGR